MILTESDVSELSNALSWWERGEYFFSFVVAAACFGEYLADFKPKWYRTGDVEGDERCKEAISKTSTLVLVAALVFELVCVVRSNTLAGRVIGSIDDLATNAAGQAKTAFDNAGAAQKLAQGANTNAGEAQKRADSATTAAGKAQGEADAVARKAKELDGQLTATNTQLDAVDAKRRELEQSLTNLAICDAPRVITNWYVKGKSWVDPLRPFAGYQGNIEYVQEPEAKRAASQIRAALKEAGWNVVMTPAVEDVSDGVLIKSYFAPSGEEFGNRTLSLNATDAVVGFLHSYFWQATRRDEASGEHDVPQHGIKIEVGLYPAVEYVLPPGEKTISEAVGEFKKKFEEQRKQRDTEISKRRNEALQTLTSEQQAVLKSQWEHLDALHKSWKEQYEQPCRPLDDLTVHP